jgi:hypothetical protein
MNGMTFEKKVPQVLCENKNGKNQMDDSAFHFVKTGLLYPNVQSQ